MQTEDEIVNLDKEMEHEEKDGLYDIPTETDDTEESPEPSNNIPTNPHAGDDIATQKNATVRMKKEK
jgi:hypothetical protein